MGQVVHRKYENSSFIRSWSVATPRRLISPSIADSVMPDVDREMIFEGAGNRAFVGRLSCLDGFADVFDDRFRGGEVAVAEIQQAETADFDGFDSLDDRHWWHVADSIVSVFPLRQKDGLVVWRHKQCAVLEAVRIPVHRVLERADVFVRRAEEDLTETQGWPPVGHKSLQSP